MHVEELISTLQADREMNCQEEYTFPSYNGYPRKRPAFIEREVYYHYTTATNDDGNDASQNSNINTDTGYS